MGKDKRITIKVKDDEVVVSMGIDTLAKFANIRYEEQLGDDVKVVDKKAFAKSVVHALQVEEEDGTTEVHLMFDRAFDYVVEQGEDGVGEVMEVS